MSDQPVRRVARFVRNHPWALTRDKLEAICEIVDARMRGVQLSDNEIQARIGVVAGPRQVQVANGVAVIPLYGVLGQKMNMFLSISGGTSTEAFVGQVRQAAADATVKAIVIDIDSPGGTVEGLLEAADALYALRGTKPIVGVVNPCCASAALHLASQCSELVCQPSGEVGSIGVFCVHEDYSEANQKAGYKPSYIFAGEHKVETNPDQPLADDARAYMQSQVDTRYNEFVEAVARGRKVSPAAVKAKFGGGRMLFAKDALEVGLIDRIATLEETINRLSAGNARRVSIGAAAAAMVAAEVTTSTIVAADTTTEPGDDDETVEPTDGSCPDGYELHDDDGLCHLLPPPADPEPDDVTDSDEPMARADAESIAAALGDE
jgi:signal peptide peptidase SppA